MLIIDVKTRHGLSQCVRTGCMGEQKRALHSLALDQDTMPLYNQGYALDSEVCETNGRREIDHGQNSYNQFMSVHLLVSESK
jgi:hypothetical protein